MVSLTVLTFRLKCVTGQNFCKGEDKIMEAVVA